MMIAENIGSSRTNRPRSRRNSSPGSTRSASRGYEMMPSAQTAGVYQPFRTGPRRRRQGDRRADRAPISRSINAARRARHHQTLFSCC